VRGLNDASINPLVSIIILNYNGSGVVDRCVKSVLDTDYPNFEVIFVDNASVDGSYDSIGDYILLRMM
jgi:glycosyltransferase involved in cell wall biosynthesis